MATTSPLLGVILTLVMLLTACGGEEEQPGSQDPSQPPEQPVTIRLAWATSRVPSTPP